MQRSSDASQRLKKKVPELYAVLQRNGDLQLLYFLVEEPLSQYVDAIFFAKNHPGLFAAELLNNYEVEARRAGR